MQTEYTMYLAELVGTALFMILGLGACCNITLRKSWFKDSSMLMVAMAWGISMVVIAVIFAPISGAHVNPAVTIGFWLGGVFPGRLVPGYIISQCIGAFIGTIFVYLLYKDHLDDEPNPGAKLGCFVTAPSIPNSFRNLLSETMATFMLMFILLSLGHLQPANGVAMFFVFCGVAGGVMSFGGLTGYAINPARDLLPRIFYSISPIKNKGTANFKYAWVPVVGPCLGAALAAGLYKLMFTNI